MPLTNARTEVGRVATVGEVAAVCDGLWPPAWSESWDNVGLLVGGRGAAVGHCLCALDADVQTIELAASMDAQMVIAHHPLPFRPLRRVLAEDATGAAVLAAARLGIAVYAAHTNLDVDPDGVNAALAAALGLGGAKPLRETGRQRLYKLVTFVPQGADDTVRDALSSAGAGKLGQYSHCSFSVTGTGTFRPLPGAHPFIGEIGSLEHPVEVRLEMLVPEQRRGAVIAALLASHPYEEVAYDLIRLENTGAARGLGMIATLPRTQRLGAFAQRVARRLGAPATRFVGDPERVLRRAAICGGAGADLVDDALEAGADVLVTADLRYHEARAAEGRGLALVDPGHQATEAPAVPAMAEAMRGALAAARVDVAVSVEPVRADVWRPAQPRR